MGSSADRVVPNTIKWAFDACPLDTDYKGERTKTGIARIQNNVPKWSDMSPIDDCVRDITL